MTLHEKIEALEARLNEQAELIEGLYKEIGVPGLEAMEEPKSNSVPWRIDTNANGEIVIKRKGHGPKKFFRGLRNGSPIWEKSEARAKRFASREAAEQAIEDLKEGGYELVAAGGSIR